MIEIELKLEVEEFPNLENLELLHDKRIVDYYYDTNDYKLISTGNFLRNRNNNKIDFKLNTGDLSHTFCNETRFNFEGFSHSEDLKNILQNIGVDYNPNFNNFEEFLNANNLSQLAVIDKHRRSYKYGDLTICLDDAKNIGKFMEVELDLPDGTNFDKDQVKANMIARLKDAGILKEYKDVKIGYVELYLKKHNPYAYNLGLYKD